MKPLEQLTILELFSGLTAFTVIVGGLIGFFKYVYPLLKKFSQIADDWQGEKDRPGVRGRLGVMERLEKIETDAASASYNSKPNSGHSAYDVLKREVTTVRDSVQEQGRLIEQFHGRMDASEADRKALHDTLDTISQKVENNE